jgi:hypothetical protein
MRKVIFMAAALLLANCARSQITAGGGSWSADITWNPCTAPGLRGFNISCVVYYGYPQQMPDGSVIINVGQVPVNSYGQATPHNKINLANFYGGALGSAIWIRTTPITVQSMYHSPPWTLTLPPQSWAAGQPSPTRVEGFGDPGDMGCSTNNQIYNEFKYTNNTASALVMSGIPGQSQPFYLAPGASCDIPITSQGDVGYQVSIAPMGQGGYLNSDFAIVTNTMGTNSFGWTYLSGDTNIGNNVNQFNNGQVASALSATGMMNGPIVWNNQGDGPAQDSTARAGYSAVVNAINQNGSQLLKAIVAQGPNGSNGSPVVNVTVTNSAAGGGASNVFVMNWPTNLGGSYNITNQLVGGTNNITVTNLGGAWTNGLTSNQMAGLGQTLHGQAGDNLTNSVIGQIMQATNAAGALSAGSVVSASGTAFGSGTLAPDSLGGGASESVSLAPGVSMTISTANLPPAFFSLHKVFAWACYVAVFVTCWRIFTTNIKEAMRVPQATTAGETILGTNVNVASSLIMAGVIVAAVATLTAVAMPKLLTYLSAIVGDPFGGLDPFGYAFVNAVVPIPLLLSCIGVITTFRLVMDSGGMVVAGIIKLLVGA